MSNDGLVIIADTHINSLSGILPVGAQYDNGNRIDRNKANRWLLNRWRLMWPEVHNWLEVTKPDRKTLVVLGDLPDMDAKGRTDRVYTRNPATVVSWCIGSF